MITVANDFAYGYEQIGGFQRVFEAVGRLALAANLGIGCADVAEDRMK